MKTATLIVNNLLPDAGVHLSSQPHHLQASLL